MQARASIIKIEHLTGKTSGKPFVALDLAENFGKGEDRETTYYKGVVFKEELMNTLKKGQFIEFKGFLTSKGFSKRDGSIGTENNVRIFGVTVLAEPKEPAANAGQQAAPAGAQAAAPERSEADEMYERHSAMADAMAADPADMDIPF